MRMGVTEGEARAWIEQHFPSALPTLTHLLDLLNDEAGRQNLVSASTLPHAWSRHIVDSAQLVPLAAKPDEPWLDIGTGAGFPGLVIAALTKAPVLCVESRARRVEWLRHAADTLGLANVTIAHAALARVESRTVATITARAVAPLPDLFAMAERFAAPDTLWLLPKGASAHEEVDDAARQWQGVFHVKQSVTDLSAGIVVASHVRRGIGGR